MSSASASSASKVRSAPRLSFHSLSFSPIHAEASFSILLYLGGNPAAASPSHSPACWFDERAIISFFV
jgi:hypothetical protein